jgi:hypothetical protein
VKHVITRIVLLVLVIKIAFILISCKSNKDEIYYLDREPAIDPDYSNVTIPQNIAPMNFIISEAGESFKLVVKSSNGTRLTLKSKNKVVNFPLRSWKKLLADNKHAKIEIQIFSMIQGGRVEAYKPIHMNIAGELIDPYLCYRTLYPGYESWGEMKITQRSIEDFKESSVIENQVLENNCVNCHTLLQNRPDRFIIHVRGSLSGTYFVNDKTVQRKELSTQNMPGNAVYPSWHPSGKYLAFSSNQMYSVIHMRPESNIELYDSFSTLVIYNIERNEISVCGDDDVTQYMDTYPVWSPNGEYLYFCRTDQIKPGFDYKKIKYDIARRSFDKETGLFGKPEIIFNALEINKSASFPTISPKGRYLIFTLHDYGAFPNWHKEADLYLLDLKTGKYNKMPLNSSDTESYCSWSSNGRWLVFSSKRGDGLTSRSYLAYFGGPDTIGKPFILPQKDPGFYKRFDKSFNRPEFVTGKIKINPRSFVTASEKESVKAVWVERKN